MTSTWLDAAILGLVQGLTEFLPVSSSAHIRIVGPLLGSGQDPGAAFTAITQIGTEGAVLLYFRKDLCRIAASWLRTFGRRTAFADPDARIGWLVIIGTLPIVLVGLAFKDAIETVLRDLRITAAMLIGFGVLLGLADRFGTQRGALDRLSLPHGWLLGLAQAMALVPGVSRSGGTITAALALGYTREAAARYSFLLAVPAVLASGFYQLGKSWGMPGPMGGGQTALATCIAFLVGYGVIVLFLRLVSTRGFAPFVVYRIFLGVAVFVLVGTGTIPALS
jgi:undecaprenyl-diphosphatase